jgi:hypothetical protein
MKLIHSIFIITIALLIFACGEKEKEQELEPLEVTVGMTYDEVEGILGKPTSIIRGTNELAAIEEIPEDPLKAVNVDTVDTKNENNRWMAPQEVKTIKEELYVTWVYDEEKTEDYYVLYDNYKAGQTITKKVPVYYLGDKKVSKEEYDAATGTLYKEPGETGKEKLYDKTGQKTKVPIDSSKSKLLKKKLPQTKGKMIEKKIKYVTKTVGSKDATVESVDKLNYEVEYKLCVVFDEASQRVTAKEFYPFAVKELKD